MQSRANGKSAMSDSIPAAVDASITLSMPRAAMTSAPSLLAATNQRYEQERLLGRGAMGAVYLVHDRETGERLALKKLFHVDGGSVLRLKREFRAVADMSHPNLVKVYELGHASDGYFLAMEYVAGRDLHGFLGLDPAEARDSRIESAMKRLRSRPS